jgi:4-hydroxybenzoate polyprenyltransferase
LLSSHVAAGLAHASQQHSACFSVPAGLGIAIVNDFKSVEGDRAVGPPLSQEYVLYLMRARHSSTTWPAFCTSYAAAGLGIAIVNDFKSIEGDRAMGLQSLPVAFGVDTAKWICVSTIDVTQLGVAAYLYAGLHQTTYAAVLLGLILPQVRYTPWFVTQCHWRQVWFDVALYGVAAMYLMVRPMLVCVRWLACTRRRTLLLGLIPPQVRPTLLTLPSAMPSAGVCVCACCQRCACG